MHMATLVGSVYYSYFFFLMGVVVIALRFLYFSRRGGVFCLFSVLVCLFGYSWRSVKQWGVKHKTEGSREAKESARRLEALAPVFHTALWCGGTSTSSPPCALLLNNI